MSKPKNQSAVFPVVYFIPLVSVVASGILVNTAITSHYPGLVELEIKLGVNSGVVKIDGRPPSFVLPPGKQ